MAQVTLRRFKSGLLVMSFRGSPNDNALDGIAHISCFNHSVGDKTAKREVRKEALNYEKRERERCLRCEILSARAESRMVSRRKICSQRPRD